MKYLTHLLCAVFLLTFFHAAGQNSGPVSIASSRSAEERAVARELAAYRTGFFNNYWIYPDSAAYFAGKIAASPSGKPYLRDMIHDDFYMVFHEVARDTIKARALRANRVGWEPEYQTFFDTCYSTLSKMSADSDPRLSGTVRPLLCWVNIIKNRQDTKEMARLAGEFLRTRLAKPGLFFDDATPRYGLFIYEELVKHPELEDLASTLIRTIIKKLSVAEDFVSPELVSQLEKNSLEKRAWLRNIQSCASNFMARRLLEKGEVEKAGDYFAAAFSYAPDLNDRGCTNINSGDSDLLWHGAEDQAETDYLNYLKAHGGEDRLLYAYAVLAFRDPVGYRRKLKEAYDKYYHGDQPFSEFWLEAVNSRLEPAPPVMLQRIDGGTFSSSDNQGKWILIDFWGTWCGPCRQEHPQLQKFYDDFILDSRNNILLFTVACRDTEEQVRLYQSEFSYSFPVAMADNGIIEAFNVLGYPTKVLITPQGDFLKIPFVTDWRNFVKEYVSLN